MKTFLPEKQIQENPSSSHSITKKHQHVKIKSCSGPIYLFDAQLNILGTATKLVFPFVELCNAQCYVHIWACCRIGQSTGGIFEDLSLASLPASSLYKASLAAQPAVRIFLIKVLNGPLAARILFSLRQTNTQLVGQSFPLVRASHHHFFTPELTYNQCSPITPTMNVHLEIHCLILSKLKVVAG